MDSGILIYSMRIIITDPNFLGDRRDEMALEKGLKAARELVREVIKRDRQFWAFELLPGPLFNSQYLYRTFQTLFLTTYFHACGTCVMGSTIAKAASGSGEEGSRFTVGEGVVDEKLRVHGVKRLRVADASVMPHIPTGPTAATCMAIGSACGCFIANQDEDET